jgi:hypothetical protein
VPLAKVFATPRSDTTDGPAADRDDIDDSDSTHLPQRTRDGLQDYTAVCAARNPRGGTSRAEPAKVAFAVRAGYLWLECVW